MVDKLEIGEMNKPKIKNLIFKELRERGLEPIDVAVGNGYYLFDFGEDSVVHFKIKGIRNWKFAIWIQDSDDNTEYLVWIFGNKRNWIDKFKPSASPISSDKLRLPHEYTEKNQHDYETPDWAVWDVLDQIIRLKKNRRIAEYGLRHSDEGFLEWLYSEFMWYDVKKPLQYFYENKIIPILYKLVLRWMGFYYGKYIVPRKLIDQNEIFKNCTVSPRWRTGIEYKEGVSEDDRFNLWCYLNDSKAVEFLRKYSNFVQFKDSEDKRGFWYKRKTEEDEEN